MSYSAFGSLILLDERLNAPDATDIGGAHSARIVRLKLRKWRVDPDVVVTSVRGMHSLGLCALLGELRRLPSEVVGDSALDSPAVDPLRRTLGALSEASPRFSQTRAPNVSTLFEMTIIPMLMQRRVVLILADLDKLERIRAQLPMRGFGSPGRRPTESLLDLYRFDRKFGAVAIPLHIDWLGSPTRRKGFL